MKIEIQAGHIDITVLDGRLFVMDYKTMTELELAIKVIRNIDQQVTTEQLLIVTAD